MIYHNSHDTFFRSPFGAVECGKEIALRLIVAQSAETVILRLWQENKETKIEMQLEEILNEKYVYKANIQASKQGGWIWYYFLIRFSSGEVYYYGNNSHDWGGEGAIYDYEPSSYQITVYKKGLTTPQWLKKSVIYQIFPDRFCKGKNTNQVQKNIYLREWEEDPAYLRDQETGYVLAYDFFAGNLAGVQEKLDYLQKLGINIIYFNPIFEAASNHRYDTGDYHKVDPLLGDNEFFRHFCQEAKKLGISIILDGVFSHTGSDSIYFNKDKNYSSIGAYQSMKSPYYKWYNFTEYPDRYECWWGIDVLPNVNEEDETYQQFIISGENSVLKYWLEMGIKGWRLDVADELPDQFIKSFYAQLKKIDSEAILIGEVWEDASNKVSYGKLREYLQGEELDSVMNYPLRSILLNFFLGEKDAQYTAQALLSLYENYPLEHFYSLMNFLGTHDTPRIATICQNTELLKLLVLWQMTFPGVPSVYYGDETVLEGGPDPLNRRTYPWGKEKKDFINWYKKLIWLRKENAIMTTGEWFTLYAQGDIYIYGRRIRGGYDIFGQVSQDNFALICFNRNSEKTEKVALDLLPYFTGEYLIDYLQESKKVSLDNGRLIINLSPLEGKIFLEKETEEDAI